MDLENKNFLIWNVSKLYHKFHSQPILRKPRNAMFILIKNKIYVGCTILKQGKTDSKYVGPDACFQRPDVCFQYSFLVSYL